MKLDVIEGLSVIVVLAGFALAVYCGIASGFYLEIGKAIEAMFSGMIS